MTRNTMKNMLALGVAGAITLGAVSSTTALPLGASGETVKQAAPESTITDVRWRRGYGWGIGLGAFALGAAAASAYPYYYGGGPYYYSGGDPYYYGYAPTYTYSYYDPYYDGRRCWRRWGRIYCSY